MDVQLLRGTGLNADYGYRPDTVALFEGLLDLKQVNNPTSDEIIELAAALQDVVWEFTSAVERQYAHKMAQRRAGFFLKNQYIWGLVVKYARGNCGRVEAKPIRITYDPHGYKKYPEILQVAEAEKPAHSGLLITAAAPVGKVLTVVTADGTRIRTTELNIYVE